MKCPKCKTLDSKVIDSRIIEDGQTIRRRRECERCTCRFTTFERRGFTDLMVIKSDNTKELYNRDKLKKSLLLAFAKRETSNEVVEKMLNNLENKRTLKTNEISSKKIGSDVLEELKDEDPIAYIRFASVYKSFDSLEDFKAFIG